MAAKLTRLTHRIAIQLHLVADSCTICSSRSRRPVLKLLDTLSYESRYLRYAFNQLHPQWLTRGVQLALSYHKSNIVCPENGSIPKTFSVEL
jgi:hypothetical protein